MLARVEEHCGLVAALSRQTASVYGHIACWSWCVWGGESWQGRTSRQRSIVVRLSQWEPPPANLPFDRRQPCDSISGLAKFGHSSFDCYLLSSMVANCPLRLKHIFTIHIRVSKKLFKRILFDEGAKKLNMFHFGQAPLLPKYTHWNNVGLYVCAHEIHILFKVRRVYKCLKLAADVRNKMCQNIEC